MKATLILAILIFLLPIALGLYWFAAPHDGAFGWMPRHVNSAYGDEVDFLYLVIMIIVAVMFFLTEGLLVWFIFRYRQQEGVKARYSHGSKKAELAWSIVPGILLFLLAVGQAGTWARVKAEFPDEKDPNTVTWQVLGEQFKFHFRHAGPDGKYGSGDDVADTARMTVPTGKKILCKMTSRDVIHSLFLIHLRVKQDVVPGMMTKAWFVASHIPVWDFKKQQAADEEKTGQRSFLVWLTPEEFAKKKVASNWEMAFAWQGLFASEHDRKISYRTYRYVPKENATKVRIWQNGSSSEGSIGDVEYILHGSDLTCAELCGQGHFEMTGTLSILPPDLYRTWLEEQSRGPRNTCHGTFQKIWDRNFSHYNR